MDGMPPSFWDAEQAAGTVMINMESHYCMGQHVKA